MDILGYAANSAKDALSPFLFKRRDQRANDVVIEILHRGICHSDLHTARNDWGNTMYPVGPGHEIIGRVVSVGGIAETHEMLDFCGKHEITSDIEIISIQDVNQAYARMWKSDVKYRFVIDMASLTAGERR